MTIRPLFITMFRINEPNILFGNLEWMSARCRELIFKSIPLNYIKKVSISDNNTLNSLPILLNQITQSRLPLTHFLLTDRHG